MIKRLRAPPLSFTLKILYPKEIEREENKSLIFFHYSHQALGYLDAFISLNLSKLVPPSLNTNFFKFALFTLVGNQGGSKGSFGANKSCVALLRSSPHSHGLGT